MTVVSNGMSQTSTEPSTSTQSPVLMETDVNVLEQLNEQKKLKEFLGWVDREYTRAKSARVSIERQWYLNMAFYQGRQWVMFAPSNMGVGVAGKLMTPPAPPYRVRSITNRVRSVIRTEMSRLTSNKPNASVVPASSEDEDLFAAQAGEQVWESIYANHRLPIIFGRAIFWTVICGTGFMKIWWDKDSCSLDAKGKEQYGDVKYAPVDPFHLFVPDLTEVELENQPWVMNVYTKPVEWAKKIYGQDFNASVVAATEIMENGFLNLQSAGTNAKPDSVLVKEVWLKAGAHPDFPKGGYAVTIDDRVVTYINQGMLFKHKEFPFVKFDHIPTGGFYAASVIEDVIPIQRELNRTRSQIIEAKNRMAKPQLIAPRGSVDPSKITSEPGIVIQYRPGLAPPQPLPLQPLPGYVLQEVDRGIADIEDVTSQHQVTKGQTPSGVTAATAISYLQERDDSVMATTYQSVEAGWEKIAKQTLSHINQFWDTKRIIQVTGVDGSFDAVALKGSDITTGMDIRIEAGSALPVSKAARQALLMDLMTQGLIPPDQGLKMMDIGGVNKLYEQMAIDERQAQRENLRMRSLPIRLIQQHTEAALNSQQVAEETYDNESENPMGGNDLQTGEPLLIPESIVPVNTWDNHEVHIEVHNRFRKSQGFELLPDEVKAQFESHVQMHAMALNQSAMQAQQMPPVNPEEMAGAPPAPGTESGLTAEALPNEGMNQFGPPGTEGGAPPPIPEVGAPA